VILLTRFHSGERFGVNPDLIERVEEMPDTIITLTNGTKHVVQESIDEIAQSVQAFKAMTLALATRMIGDPSDGTPTLRIVHGGTDDDSGDPATVKEPSEVRDP
jgi:flagellar protein FlbD